MANQKIRKDKRNRDGRVLLSVWVQPSLRTKGQAAIKILGHGDMTKFVETKLGEAIKQAGIN